MRQAGEHSSLPPVHSGVRFRWVLVAPDSNIALTFPCAGDIVGRLHAHQGVHLDVDGLFHTQSHSPERRELPWSRFDNAGRDTPNTLAAATTERPSGMMISVRMKS